MVFNALKAIQELLGGSMSIYSQKAPQTTIGTYTVVEIIGVTTLNTKDYRGVSVLDDVSLRFRTIGDTMQDVASQSELIRSLIDGYDNITASDINVFDIAFESTDTLDNDGTELFGVIDDYRVKIEINR